VSAKNDPMNFTRWAFSFLVSRAETGNQHAVATDKILAATVPPVTETLSRDVESFLVDYLQQSQPHPEEFDLTIREGVVSN
jgi:hypothetical protein